MPFLSRKPRLLLLDDDPSMQRLMRVALQKQGYRIDVVSSGAQAIERTKTAEYDALLLDVMTPTEGGLTVIRHLRKTNPMLLKRILLVTASPNSVLRSVENDVFGIVRKPFEARELQTAVSAILQQSG